MPAGEDKLRPYPSYPFDTPRPAPYKGGAICGAYMGEP